MKNKIDEILKKYFSNFLLKYEFQESDFLNSNMGSFYEYKNKDLKFRIINDRGIMKVSIASILSTTFFDIELINSLLIYKNERKLENKTLRKRLDLESVEKIIQKNYQTLKILFDEKNYLKTENELMEIGTLRAKSLFNI